MDNAQAKGESIIRPRPLQILPKSTNIPVMTVNWCLTNLVLLTDMNQTLTRLGMHYREFVHYAFRCVTALEASDSLKVT